MTPLFPARRRAERFDALVDGGRRDDADRSTTELLELVGALRSVPEPQARPEFVADLRERLMLAAATELTPAPATARERDAARLTITPKRTRRERRVGIALGAAALIGATTSMAVASQSAIPGDALYPVKRAIENTEAGFAVGDDAKGQTRLGDASERLDEVGKLTKTSKPDAKLVTQTLNDFAAQATEAGDLAMSAYEQDGDQSAIRGLQAFTHQSLDTLGGLEAVIPAGSRDALLNAAQQIFAIGSAASNVCPDCGEPLTDLPGNLLAGGLGDTAEDLTGAIAGGELPGTTPPSETPGATQPQQHQGVKGHGKPSGLNPPETPITIPPAPSETADPLGNILPGTNGGTTGGGTSNGGKGGKHNHNALTPVTETVNQVVTGVVEGVTGVLNGLTGN